MRTLLIIFIVVSVVLINIIWYRIKLILRDNNYHVHYFFHHLTDISNFVKLVIKEENKRRKAMYYLLSFLVLLITLVTIICFIYLLKSYS
jgi:hypothetical protein